MNKISMSAQLYAALLFAANERNVGVVGEASGLDVERSP